MKYPKPKKFIPNQNDLERIGNDIAKSLSKDKVVIAGNKKIRGSNEKGH